MTPETAGKIHVTYIIGVSFPANIHFREEIVPVNVDDFINRPIDFFLLSFCQIRIIFLIETPKTLANFYLRFIGGGIRFVERFNRLFFNVGQRRVHLAACDRLIDGTLGSFINMRGAIMAIHTIHAAHFSGRRFIL